MRPGERRILVHLPQEVPAVHGERAHPAQRAHGRGVDHVLEDRHLADELALARDPDACRATVPLQEDLDLALQGLNEILGG